MKKSNAIVLGLAFGLSAALVSPSWARFHGRYYGGYGRGFHRHGFRSGLSFNLGVGSAYPYYSDYYEPVYVVPQPQYYYREVQPAPIPETPIQDNARIELKTLRDEIQNRRSRLEFLLEDGDIEADEYNDSIARLNAIEQEANQMASANRGVLSGRQVKDLRNKLQGRASDLAPASSSSEQNEIMIPDPQASQSLSSPDASKTLADFHTQLQNERKLLDRQRAKGGITQAQYDRNVKALEALSSNERASSIANSGSLPSDQVEMLNQGLQRVHEQIQKDLME